MSLESLKELKKDITELLSEATCNDVEDCRDCPFYKLSDFCSQIKIV